MPSRLAPQISGPLPKAPPKRKMDRRLKDPAYMKWLHELPCVLTGQRERLTVHHVMAGRESYGKKEDDSVCVPLIAELHMHDFGPGSLERIGERRFWNGWALDPLALARDLRTCFETYGHTQGSIATGKEIIRAHREMASARKRWGIKIYEERTTK